MAQNTSDVATTTTTLSNIIHSKQDMTQNYALIYLNAGIDETDEEFQSVLNQLQNVLNDVTTFTSLDECVDFLTDLEDSTTFLVVEDTISKQIIPLIHDIPQLDHVYGFSNSKSLSSEWIKEWSKVKGIYRTSTLLCRAIELAIKQQDQDSIAMSFVSVNGSDSNQDLDQLEPSFMYTQIFKEILLETKYDEKSLHDFVTFCQSNNCGSPVNIDLFKKEYHDKSAVWWYTRPSFIYSMLNDALRTLQVDVIIKMGFYISQLHQEIQQLHQKQFLTDNPKSFMVYRGQALREKDFETLLETRSGLISFNNFLSTSADDEVARGHAQLNSEIPGKIGVLFKIFINPSVSSTPFANITQVSYYEEENEVLFSMHTVFRIINIKPIDGNGRLYQVDLQLTADDDEELRILTNHIANQIGGDTGWDRLANFLLRINHLDKAEELYNTLLEQASNDSDRVQYYNQLFNIKFDQGDFEAAAFYLEKIVKIEKKKLPANDPSLSTSHNNNGFICCKTEECARTLIFYDDSPEIDEDELPVDHDSFTSNFHNVASADDSMRTSSDASLYEKAVEIYERTLAPDQSCLSISSNNVAGIFDDMMIDSKALAFNEKLLEIRLKSLSPNHRDLAISYFNIAKMYHGRGEHSKALSFHQQSLEILEKTLPVSHPYLGIVCDHIAVAYHDMAEYSKALLFHEKALRIFQRALPPSHPDLATVYNNIASLHYEIKEYPKALLFHEKALEIGKEILLSNDHDLATFYYDVGATHVEMGEDSKALPFYEKAMEIFRETLPLTHPSMASSFDNIASLYYRMGEYAKALEFYEKALAIGQETLLPNDDDLATFYQNVGATHVRMGEDSKALPFYEKALEIFREALSPKHPSMASFFNNIASLYYRMGEYATASGFYEKGLEIYQETLPPNDPDLATLHHNVGTVYHCIGKYSEALSHFERALDMFKISVHANDSRLQSVKRNIETVKKEL